MHETIDPDPGGYGLSLDSGDCYVGFAFDDDAPLLAWSEASFDAAELRVLLAEEALRASSDDVIEVEAWELESRVETRRRGSSERRGADRRTPTRRRSAGRRREDAFFAAGMF